MRRLALAAVLTLAAAPAAATGDLYCADPGGSGASFAMGFGHVPGLAILGATVEAAGQVWSMDGAGAARLVLAQGAEDGGRIVIDFADEQVTAILVSVRLQAASESGHHVIAGTLRVAGVGVWPLVCEGF